MPLFDWPLSQLREYRPALTSEPDFDAFWQKTLAQAGTIPLQETFIPAGYPARLLSVYDVHYTGWNGARIAGWYIKPQGNGPFPGIVIYHGYSGSRAYPHAHFAWAAQGYAVLAVDTRGQSGESTDPTVYSTGHVKGWMTAGILDPQEYYYRGAYVDCVRALDVLAARPEVDMAHVGVTGGSQGGGLSLAVCALDARPKACMADIPYLCHYERAVDMAALMPYLEISDYIKIYPQRERQVFRTLSYFDNMNLAPRNRSNVLMSIGLQDDCCPPSSSFAAFNHLACNKELKIYRYHKHEDIPAHWAEKFAWAEKYV
jgi:cephalosporin-C deacetylase